MRDMIWSSIDGTSWQRTCFDRFYARINFVEQKDVYKLNVKSIDELINNWSEHNSLDDAKVHALTVCQQLLEQENARPTRGSRVVGHSYSPKPRKSRTK